MPQAIKTIRLSLPYKLGSVNCYLAATSAGYVLIDTGSSNQRAALEKELESGGCKPGNLRLIVITHGDFDHTGNCAYLSKKFGAPIAMHAQDSAMLERGDMFANRQKGNNVFTRKLVPILFGFGKSERTTPNIFVEDGSDLSEYGFEAKVLHLPGHSRGSIGVLTANRDLFCGDLLDNVEKPSLSTLLDDPAAAQASLEKLKNLEIHTVYPGHGGPFPMEQFASTRSG
ncbi:MAG: MBL fold metallo-hydrolase [Anaerolineales bacterium]|nr:MBL fold metallo-hydrolase [Anaerolineales bacterium]